jgi:hypothetical protein
VLFVQPDSPGQGFFIVGFMGQIVAA